MKNEDLEKQLEECKNKCEEYLNNWKRERADFINYKKEEMERIEGIIKYSKEETALRIIPILDNFYIAEKEIPKEHQNDNWAVGMLHIKNQILDFLKNFGVEEIQSENGDFNPNTQEAVEIIEKEGIESGKVAEEIKKGYMLNGKVIRPSQVKVTK